MTAPATTPLTADLCAIAIVAAANAYGDHPISAVTAKAGRTRRSLAPAAAALVAQTGQKVSAVCRVIGIGAATYEGAIRSNELSYRTALRSATRQVSKALGRQYPDVSQGGKEPKLPAVARAAPPAPIIVVQEEPPIEASRVDHTAAIAEAMRRRAARSAVPFSVAGVEKDEALLAPKGGGGCAWPMGDPRDPDYRSCAAPAVVGRMYCAPHLKAAGLKASPKPIQTAGRVAAAYDDREVG